MKLLMKEYTELVDCTISEGKAGQLQNICMFLKSYILINKENNVYSMVLKK